MEEIIQYFAEVCYERFMEEQEKIFKNPKGFSDFEKGVTEAVNGLGREFIRLTLEEMNRCFKDSLWRREKWYVEDTDRKQQIMFWRIGVRQENGSGKGTECWPVVRRDMCIMCCPPE